MREGGIGIPALISKRVFIGKVSFICYSEYLASILVVLSKEHNFGR